MIDDLILMIEGLKKHNITSKQPLIVNPPGAADCGKIEKKDHDLLGQL